MLHSSWADFILHLRAGGSDSSCILGDAVAARAAELTLYGSNPSKRGLRGFGLASVCSLSLATAFRTDFGTVDDAGRSGRYRGCSFLGTNRKQEKLKLSINI